jgi:hypothetical protein
MSDDKVVTRGVFECVGPCWTDFDCQCASLDGLTVVSNTWAFPPIHEGCVCVVKTSEEDGTS